MRLSKNEISEIINLYVNENKSATAISKLYNCTPSTILNHLNNNNIKTKNSGHWHKKVEFEVIKYDYEILKLSTTKIAEKYGMNPVSVWERLKKGGVQIKNQKEAIFETNHKIPLSEHTKICDLYIKDKTQTCGKIAKLYNVNKSTISNILKKNNIIVEKAFGLRNAAYKGGITPLHTKIRNCEKAEFWKRACLERDEYKCKISGVNKNLQVHHYPLTFSEIFTNFLREHPDLNPINDSNKLFELSQNYEPFWDINNGITISEEMHKKLHTQKGVSDEEILSLYNQGWSCQKISEHFQKSRAFAISRLRSIGHERRSTGSYNANRRSVSKEETCLILADYIKGDKIKDICEKFTIGSVKLYSILKENNINPGNRPRDQRSDATKQAERVIQLHSMGVTNKEIAKIYNVSDTTIRNILKENKIETEINN
jgi:transposase